MGLGSRKKSNSRLHRRRRTLWLLTGMALVCLPVAAGASDIRVIAHGQAGHDTWRVTVASDGVRKGVCLEVAVIKVNRTGGSASGQCSAPAERRGLLRSVFRRSDSGRPRLTVVGGAFNQKVKRITAVRVDGGEERLYFRHLRGGAGTLDRFRYIAVARRGPWCIDELITKAADGEILWQVKAMDVLHYDPNKFCV